MTRELYRYTFPLEEVEASLLLALWGTQSLHGEAQVRLDATHFLDADRRSCITDSPSPQPEEITA